MNFEVLRSALVEALDVQLGYEETKDGFEAVQRFVGMLNEILYEHLTPEERQLLADAIREPMERKFNDTDLVIELLIQRLGFKPAVVHKGTHIWLGVPSGKMPPEGTGGGRFTRQDGGDGFWNLIVDPAS